MAVAMLVKGPTGTRAISPSLASRVYGRVIAGEHDRYSVIVTRIAIQNDFLLLHVRLLLISACVKYKLHVLSVVPGSSS